MMFLHPKGSNLFIFMIIQNERQHERQPKKVRIPFLIENHLIALSLSGHKMARGSLLAKEAVPAPRLWRGTQRPWHAGHSDGLNPRAQ